ncbi:MAG: hypothetical protein GC179_13595 [Anaerolineaceae bacterium]|nr:hypothetical protein [Anaerolineaceae bacterium]
MTRYSPAHKKLVLRLFKEVFKQDVVATSRYTGIPERTLRDWVYAARRAAASPKPAAAAVPIVQRRT